MLCSTDAGISHFKALKKPITVSSITAAIKYPPFRTTFAFRLLFRTVFLQGLKIRFLFSPFQYQRHIYVCLRLNCLTNSSLNLFTAHDSGGESIPVNLLSAFVVYFIKFGCHKQLMYYNRVIGFYHSQNKISKVQTIPRQF